MSVFSRNIFNLNIFSTIYFNWRIDLFYLNKIIIILLVFLLSPVTTIAAEVLQVRSANILQIGDQNRNYTVRLGCISIDLAKESEAKSWLKKELPRRTRVNLLPLESVNGVLVARVIPLDTDVELSNRMVEKGLGSNTCS